jgi:GTP cyclohydrolase I
MSTSAAQPPGGPRLRRPTSVARLEADEEDRVAVDVERVERAVTEILSAIGEDPARRPGQHAGRVAAMYEELFSGLHDDPADHLEVTFAAEHDEMVMVRDIPFASLCEHHLVPFIGRAHVAYIPGRGRAHHRPVQAGPAGRRLRPRLQVQERMTTEIADAIEARRSPPRRAGRGRGRAPVHVHAGGEEAGHLTVTSAVRGLFRNDVATRAEAMQFVRAADRRFPGPVGPTGAGLRCVVMPERDDQRGPSDGDGNPQRHPGLLLRRRAWFESGPMRSRRAMR